jgi:tetratricopeptide (TPR) repeat protein
MKKFLTSFFLLFFVVSFSQTNYPEINSLLNESNRYSKINQDSALVFSEKAHLLAKNKKDTFAIALSGYYYSTALILLKRYSEAETILDFNLNNREQLSENLIGDSYYNLGAMNDYQEKYDVALKNYFIALANYEVSENKRGLARSNLQIGVIYGKLGKKDLENYYYDAAMPGDKTGKIAGEEKSPSDIYEEQAIESRKMLRGLEGSTDLRTKGIILYNLAYALCRNNKWEEAIPFFQQSIALKERINFKAQIDKSYLMLGQCYSNLGKTDLAIEALNTAKNLTTKRQQTAIIEVELANAFQQKGDYENALVHYKNFKNNSDSIFELHENDRIAKITSGYDLDRKMEQIIALEKENQETFLLLGKNRKQSLIIAFVAVLLLLTSVWFIKRWRNSLKRVREAHLETEVIKKTVEAQHLLLKNKSKVYLEDLQFIKSDGNYVEFHSMEQRTLDRNKLKAILSRLPPNFVRVHRSYIVNKNEIASFTSSTVFLKSGVEIPLSRTFKSNL